MNSDNRFKTALAAHDHIAPTPEDGEALYEFYKDCVGFDMRHSGLWQDDYAEVVGLPCGGLKGKRVLDLGCGMGAQPAGFLRAGADVLAVELAWWLIRESPFPELRGRLLQGDVRNLAVLGDEQFDVVHASMILEHIPSEDIPGVLGNVHRLLKPGGYAVIILPTWGADEGIVGGGGDPSHACLRSAWWWEFRVLTEVLDLDEAGRLAIERHPMCAGGIGNREQDWPGYHWGVIVARRRPTCECNSS